MFSIAGKKALITGASGGIGRAVAGRLAAEGAAVVLAGRNIARLNEALHNLGQDQTAVELEGTARLETGQCGGQGPEEVEKINSRSEKHKIHVFNVTDPVDWKAVVERHPDIDILVNCAGIAQERLLTRMEVDDVKDILATNLRGPIWGCRFVGKQMIRTGSPGCIVNVSSILSRKGRTGVSVYAASKAGLLGLTTSLAIELGHYGIRVNAVLPGYIDTRMTKNIEETAQNSVLGHIPLKRFGTPDEVADAVAFLAKNPYASNCILNLDGGLSAT